MPVYEVSYRMVFEGTIKIEAASEDEAASEEEAHEYVETECDFQTLEEYGGDDPTIDFVSTEVVNPKPYTGKPQIAEEED